MKSIFSKLGSYFYEPKLYVKLIVFGIIITLCLLVGDVVYLTGGTKLSYLHFLYIPIIIGGFWFGPAAGVLIGIFAGFIVGPFMPESVTQHAPQNIETWAFRLVFFMIIGMLSGFASRLARDYLHVVEQKYLKDHETELPNYKGLEKLYKTENPSKKLSGLIVIKLKQINEVEKAFGPSTLTDVALTTKARLCDILSEDEVIGRLSNDSFVVCTHKEKDPLKLAYYLKQNLQTTYKFNAIPFLIEAYFGVVSLENGPVESFEDLLKRGVLAASLGLESHKEITLYNEKINDTSERNIYILHELNHAIEQDFLTLNYQPVISLQTNEVIGVEALARWNHPDLGTISPLEFIGIAEKTLLINPYTKWLLKKSFTDLAAWRDKGLELMLSLNFSMKNFEDQTVLKEIFIHLEKYNIPPTSVVIEVTESAIAANISRTADILHMLRERGLKIAIDDFGTGHSSLKYLFELPLDILKIDNSFTEAMLSNSAAEAIIRSAIVMGHELNLKVVAEGIRETAHIQHLKKLSCDYGQGYFISYPMTFDLMTEWLEARRTHLRKEPVSR